jgi:hypothetical protein
MVSQTLPQAASEAPPGASDNGLHSCLVAPAAPQVRGIQSSSPSSPGSAIGSAGKR